MLKEKRSFFERLTGTVSLEDNEFQHEYDAPEEEAQPVEDHEEKALWENDTEPEEGQLTVDVHQTADTIVIKTLVAGVKPENLDVSITRDMVTIRGHRENDEEVSDENYFYRELYWGAFARTIMLPQEIEVEASTAAEKHGLLVLTLPKINKEKQTKLKVRVG